MSWRSSDAGSGLSQYNGKWPTYFHRKLGGSASSNLDWDVKGHIKHSGFKSDLKGGISGSVCRFIDGTTSVSTHAWGIAFDINARYEALGQPCQSVTERLAEIWKAHKWTWGRSFSRKDCVHFQYASGF